MCQCSHILFLCLLHVAALWCNASEGEPRSASYHPLPQAKLGEQYCADDLFLLLGELSLFCAFLELAESEGKSHTEWDFQREEL
jgi:hypothetical protein